MRIYVSSFFAKSWSLQRMLEVECRIVFHRLFPSFWQPVGALLQNYCSLVAALVAVLLQPVGALLEPCCSPVGALVAALVAALIAALVGGTLLEPLSQPCWSPVAALLQPCWSPVAALLHRRNASPPARFLFCNQNFRSSSWRSQSQLILSAIRGVGFS